MLSPLTRWRLVQAPLTARGELKMLFTALVTERLGGRFQPRACPAKSCQTAWPSPEPTKGPPAKVS